MDHHTHGQLFVAVFDILPAFGVSSDAVIVFEERLETYLWTLYQTGLLAKVKSQCRQVGYVVDLEDEETLVCFNDLPFLFDENNNFAVFSLTWQLMLYERQIPEHRDILRISSEGHFYIEGYWKAWQGYENTRESLTEEGMERRRKFRGRS